MLADEVKTLGEGQMGGHDGVMQDYALGGQKLWTGRACRRMNLGNPYKEQIIEGSLVSDLVFSLKCLVYWAA